MSNGGRVIRQEVQDKQGSETRIKKTPTGTVLVRAEEMLNFVTEWMKHGSGDLIIDESLCDRLKTYTEYRKRLDKAVSELLEQEFDRYIVREEYVDTDAYAVVNFTSADNKVLLTAEVFVDYDVSDDDDTVGVPKLISVRDSKRLLASLGNKMISYAYDDEEELYFDFFLYCKELGIDLKTKKSQFGEIKSIQLILPADWEKQNEKSSSSNVQ